METVTTLPRLPARSADSNKGDFGRVLVVAGSRGMSGAAILCGTAALRSGAGLVKLAVAHDIWPIVAVGNPCYMTIPMAQDDAGRLAGENVAQLLELAEANDILAAGPGLGRSQALTRLLGELVQRSDTPLVLDADGLNAFVDSPMSLKNHAGQVIITPHPGEFGRLVGVDTKTVQAAREEQAVRCARDFRVIVVLKGHGTIVTDGRRVYRNSTGNPGMATGGTGDVLTGLTAALWGQGLEAFEAAQLATHVHGLAGDLARADLGEQGLIASDLLTYLPQALRTVAG